MFFGVRVGAVGGDDVTDPAECSAGAKPESRGEDQPENARQNPAVV